MSSPTTALSARQIKDELKRLRQGQALARPSSVLTLSHDLRQALLGNAPQALNADEQVVAVAEILQTTIGRMEEPERLYARVDLNLAEAHSYRTLTERQESLAAELKCASKTVRRHADQALETLALMLATGHPSARPSLTAHASRTRPSDDSWQPTLLEFWGLSKGARVDIVCSEIPEDERPYFASPQDRNYLRYAKFADLDSLIHVRTQLAQLAPSTAVRDFSPSEYFESNTDVLIVIGGPPWNAKYREFLPQLPYYFDPHPLGEDDPLVIPCMDHLTLGPKWTAQQELLEDVAVFTRLTLAQGTRVFLLGGCLTLGVLGAAKCFLLGQQGARNAQYITELIDEQDFVMVTETRRIGGFSDSAELHDTPPLVVLARSRAEPFAVITDNSTRYGGEL